MTHFCIPKNRGVNNWANVAFNVFAQIYSSVFANVRSLCKEQTCANDPFFVQWDNFPFCCLEEMQGSGINLDYRRDVFYAFFLILAKAASSSLDTGNFSPKAGE